jgi:hypothetical protein
VIIGDDNDDDDDGCAENAATTFNGRCDTTTRNAVVDTNAEAGIMRARDGIISPLNKNDVVCSAGNPDASFLGTDSQRREAARLGSTLCINGVVQIK